MVFIYQGSGRVFMNDIPLTSGIFYGWQRSSVIKSPLFLPVYYSDVLDVFNQNEHKERILLTGRDIEFSFKNSENGMHNFSFNLESGQLVAIMGGSGVGKSTLLSILNGNIIPGEGNVCLNGHPLSDPECKQLIGFVPQDDLLIEDLRIPKSMVYRPPLFRQPDQKGDRGSCQYDTGGFGSEQDPGFGRRVSNPENDQRRAT